MSNISKTAPSFTTVREHLINIARQKETIQYQELSELCRLGLDMNNPQHRVEIGEILDEISKHEHENNRPLLSAVVATDSTIPGNGFYELAKELGLYSGSTETDRLIFWVEELKKVYDFWKET